MKSKDSWLSIIATWVKFLTGSYILGLVLFVLVRDIGVMLSENTYNAVTLTFISILTGAGLIILVNAVIKDIKKKSSN